MQASEIMPQVGVVAFDAVSLALSRRNGMSSRRIQQGLIGVEAIAVILPRSAGFVYDRLNRIECSLGHHVESQEAAGGTVNGSHEIDAAFFEPTNV